VTVTSKLKRLGRTAYVAGAVALLAVTVFAATVQGGVFAPKFDTFGGGTGGDARVADYFSDFQNASWRSWTITGVHLADNGPTRARSGGQDIALSVRRGSDGQGPALQRLTVGPGQKFTVDLVERRQICHLPRGYRTSAQVQQYALSRFEHQPRIPTVIAVATPFGTRTVGTTFRVGC
jgi:hypothetical protein